MCKNDPITILDPNPASRVALAAYFVDLGLEVAVGDPKEEPAAAVVLSVQETEDNPFKLPKADIFVKPLRFGALVERVSHHLLKNEAPDLPEFLEIGPFQLDWRNHVLVNNKEEIKTTEKETAILKLLYQAGEEMSRDMLLEKVWGYADNIETHTLETHIYRLRQKLEEDASDPQLLLTAENGYFLSK